MKKEEKRHLITSTKPKSPIAEAYRTLRTNIQFSGLDKSIQVLLVTSTGPGEGKSTTLANLGVTMAQSGAKVLIIDCDLRKPVQHKVFELSNLKGLTNALVEKLSHDQLIQTTKVPNLSVLTSGPIPPNPSELLSSKPMQLLLQDLKKQYDTILIDSPPTIAVTDAVLLSAQTDGVILVLRAGITKKELAKQAKEQLEKANSKIIGTVLNGVKISGDDYNYYYYYGQQEGRTRHA